MKPQWVPGTTVGTRDHSGPQGPQWAPGNAIGTQWLWDQNVSLGVSDTKMGPQLLLGTANCVPRTAMGAWTMMGPADRKGSMTTKRLNLNLANINIF